jgi:hypothetical protein
MEKWLSCLRVATGWAIGGRREWVVSERGGKCCAAEVGASEVEEGGSLRCGGTVTTCASMGEGKGRYGESP